MSIFEKPLGQLIEADLERLVRIREPESLRLDFKEEFDRREKSKRKLAKHVVAFANKRQPQPCLIIVGLKEGDVGGVRVAEALSPLDGDISEDVDNVLSSRATPPATYDVRSIPAEGERTGRCYCVIQVKPSPRPCTRWRAPISSARPGRF